MGFSQCLLPPQNLHCLGILAKILLRCPCKSLLGPSRYSGTITALPTGHGALSPVRLMGPPRALTLPGQEQANITCLIQQDCPLACQSPSHWASSIPRAALRHPHLRHGSEEQAIGPTASGGRDRLARLWSGVKGLDDGSIRRTLLTKHQERHGWAR